MRPCLVISTFHHLLVYPGALCFFKAHLRHSCPFLCLGIFSHLSYVLYMV